MRNGLLVLVLGAGGGRWRYERGSSARRGDGRRERSASRPELKEGVESERQGKRAACTRFMQQSSSKKIVLC